MSKLNEYLEKIYNEVPVDLVPTSAPDKKSDTVKIKIKHGTRVFDVDVNAKNIDISNSDATTYALSNTEGFLNDVRNALIGKNLIGNETGFSKKLKETFNSKKQISKSVVELEVGTGKDKVARVGVNQAFSLDKKPDTFE